jgi:hypothetical protein
MKIVPIGDHVAIQIEEDTEVTFIPTPKPTQVNNIKERTECCCCCCPLYIIAWTLVICGLLTAIVMGVVINKGSYVKHFPPPPLH